MKLIKFLKIDSIFKEIKPKLGVDILFSKIVLGKNHNIKRGAFFFFQVV